MLFIIVHRIAVLHSLQLIKHNHVFLTISGYILILLFIFVINDDIDLSCISALTKRRNCIYSVRAPV